MPRFHLTRHFMVASLLVFFLFGAALYQAHRLRSHAMHAIQIEDSKALRELRIDLTSLVSEAAHRDLTTLQEQHNVDLARSLANALRGGPLLRYLEQSRALSFSQCVAFEPDASAEAQRQRQACHRTVGQQLRHMPAFAQLDSAVRTALRDTQVFRFKIFDMRGITIYSTDHAQLGDDRSQSPGWRGAAYGGTPVSQLTRRHDMNRLHQASASQDFVNSYLPVYGDKAGDTVAVVETYSDVRAFLEQLSGFIGTLENKVGARELAMAQRLDAERATLDQQGQRSTAVLLALMTVVYVALLLIVHRAQRQMEQEVARVQKTRTHLMQMEKMVMLGHMVAGVAHQLNTPLAYCRANLQCFSDAFGRVMSRLGAQHGEPSSPARVAPQGPLRDNPSDTASKRDIEDVRQMIEDTRYGVQMMEELVHQLRNFTRLDQAPTDVIDLNVSIASAVYMARALMSPRIRIEECYGSLPRMWVRVSLINQAVLNLLMNAGQAIAHTGCIVVATRIEGPCAVIEVSDDGCGMSAEETARVLEGFYTTKVDGSGFGLYLVRDIVEGHGGRVTLRSAPGRGTSASILLPIPGGPAA